MTDYTQLFEKILFPVGVVPEFPFDLLHPDLNKKLKNKVWPHCSRAFIWSPRPVPQIEFLTEGDYVSVPMFGVSYAANTRLQVEKGIQTKINNYCMEMIKCEQEFSVISTRKNRIIASIGVQTFDDPKHGGFYGWDEVGFLILRK